VIEVHSIIVAMRKTDVTHTHTHTHTHTQVALMLYASHKEYKKVQC